nr:uncharacterized protein CI109_006330 [Kwoniella shandongensis]KAA5525351.1 hypothetical protein CI109_006330 [Kwoniella shandongensis]
MNNYRHPLNTHYQYPPSCPPRSTSPASTWPKQSVSNYGPSLNQPQSGDIYFSPAHNHPARIPSVSPIQPSMHPQSAWSAQPPPHSGGGISSREIQKMMAYNPTNGASFHSSASPSAWPAQLSHRPNQGRTHGTQREQMSDLTSQQQASAPDVNVMQVALHDGSVK